MLGYSDVKVRVCVSFEFVVSPFGSPAWIGGSQVEEPVCGRGEGTFRSGEGLDEDGSEVWFYDSRINSCFSGLKLSGCLVSIGGCCH